MKGNSVLSGLAIVLVSLPLPALAAVEIDKCQKIYDPGTYVLINDLPGAYGYISGGDCLIIRSDSVSIDLAGYTITGNGNDNAAGITWGGVERKRIHISGGSIVEFHNGIALADNDNVTVQGMTLMDNWGDGINVGNHSVVTGNVVTNPDDHAEGTGIAAGIGSRVIGNLVSDNILFGISVKEESAVRTNNVRATIGEEPIDMNGIPINAGIKVLCPSSVTDNTVTQTAAEESLGIPRDIDLKHFGQVLSGACLHSNNLGNVIVPGGPQ